MTKNDIINKFIVSESDYSREWAEKIAERALKFAKVSKAGDILLQTDKLSPDNKIKLSLVVRFIAHSFDEQISDSMSPTELSKVLTNESMNAVGSRMSLLARTGFLKKSDRGQYSIQPYKIEGFLEALESADAPKSETTRRSGPKKSGGDGTGRGVGKDIAELINAEFFETPKTVNEVKAKLEEEVKYHDIRLIDAMIRNTFVASKKVLKRIANEGEGKAKWKYVIRK